MKTKYLSWFYEMSQCHSLRQASQKVGVAPSTLSRCLDRLEEDAGLPLYIHDAPSFTLTDAGKIYLEYAGRMLNIQNSLYRSLSQEKKVSRPVLRVGASTISLQHLVEIFPQLLLEYPDLQLTTREGLAYTLWELLRKKEIDLAICSISNAPSHDMKAALFYRNELVLAVPSVFLPAAYLQDNRERAMPKADSKLFKWLEGVPFLRHASKTSMGQKTKQIYADLEFSPVVEFVSESSLFIDGLAKTGQYAYFTFSSKAGKEKNMRYFRLPETYYIYTGAMFRREYELSPVDDMLCALLSQKLPFLVGGEPCPNTFTKSLVEAYNNRFRKGGDFR